MNVCVGVPNQKKKKTKSKSFQFYIRCKHDKCFVDENNDDDEI